MNFIFTIMATLSRITAIPLQTLYLQYYEFLQIFLAHCICFRSEGTVRMNVLSFECGSPKKFLPQDNQNSLITTEKVQLAQKTELTAFPKPTNPLLIIRITSNFPRQWKLLKWHELTRTKWKREYTQSSAAVLCYWRMYKDSYTWLRSETRIYFSTCK